MESKQAHHNYGMISLDLRLRIGREEEAPYACSYCNRRFFSKLPRHGYGVITLDLRLTIGGEEDAACACSFCNCKFLAKQPLGAGGHQNACELEGTAGTRKRRRSWTWACGHDDGMAAGAPEVDLSLRLWSS